MAEPDDYREVSSMLEEGHSTLTRSMASEHKKLQMKLKFDQDSEHDRLASFLEVTDKDFLDISREGMVSYSWLAGLTVVLLLVMLYVMYCVYRARSSVTPTVPVDDQEVYSTI